MASNPVPPSSVDRFGAAALALCIACMKHERGNGAQRAAGRQKRPADCHSSLKGQCEPRTPKWHPAAAEARNCDYGGHDRRYLFRSFVLAVVLSERFVASCSPAVGCQAAIIMICDEGSCLLLVHLHYHLYFPITVTRRVETPATSASDHAARCQFLSRPTLTEDLDERTTFDLRGSDPLEVRTTPHSSQVQPETIETPIKIKFATTPYFQVGPRKVSSCR